MIDLYTWTTPNGRKVSIGLEEFGLSYIDLIKVDVEGSELSVLRGSIEILRELRPAIYVEINSQHLRRAGATPLEARDFLEALGYRIWVNQRIERRGHVKNFSLSPLSVADLDSDLDTYWLAVHPESFRRSAPDGGIH